MWSPPWILRGADDRFDHGAVSRGGAEHQIRHDPVKCGAGRAAAGLAFQRRIDRELDRLQHRRGHLGEPAPRRLLARQQAERRALQAGDADRHHRRSRFVGDQAGAVIHFHQAAGDGDASLGEDHQRMAGLDHLTSERIIIGLSGSSGTALAKRRNGFTHQRCAMLRSMANTGVAASASPPMRHRESSHG